MFELDDYAGEDSQLAETSKEMYDEDDLMEKQEEESDKDSCVHTNSSFLLELNLVMLVAFLTLSPEELSQFEDSENVNIVKDQERKAVVPSKLQNRKRELSDFKVADRRATKLQRRVMDSRHGRKM
ncbi:hypothetical protein Ancab_037965 [Ancistrocladus abbreviatus]